MVGKSVRFIFGFVLIDSIKTNHAIIIPINLREIYYSSYYNEADWSHPIVINGFDTKKKFIIF